MALTKQSRISQLAAAIQSHAAKLDEYCAAEGIPSPSFDEEYPSDLSPEFEASRNEVLVATDELFDLMLGPRRLAELEPAQVSSITRS